MAAGLSSVRAFIAFAFAACGAAHSFQPLTVAGEPTLQLHWQPAKEPGPRPAIIALHGCSGLYNNRGRFDDRYTFYAQRWNAAGWHVVAPDSLSSRGQGSLCAQTAAERTIKVAHRRDDVLRAAAWLMARDDVDPQRIAVVGWSHGASTALEVVDRSLWRQPPAAIVTYYPGCGGWKRRALVEPAAPVLMLLGEADDWTPAAPCKELAERFQSRQPDTVAVHVFADGHHGFDSRAPVRFRPDIPAGRDKRGVHVGGNPAAREASLAALDQFLALHLQAK
ncbi:MAG TPA: dienelactone hydrolase family protein [Burkholderiaceae bacterium]|nr:dienelactone hydrolase family protein [Burkholderiaceae bacterium]